MIERYLCKHVQRRALLFYPVRLSLYTPGIWSADQITGVYIYSERVTSSRKTVHKCQARGRFSWKRVSLGDIIWKKKRGSVFLGVHSEKQIYPILLLLFNSAILEYFLDMRKYLVRGPNNRSIYIQREKLCSSMSARGRYSRKTVSLGILFSNKRA